MEQQVQGLEKAADEIKMAVQGKNDLLNQGLVNLSISNRQNFVKISIETPKGQKRLPCDVVCVLDISGSMATEAHVKNSEGIKEKHGLSYLDLLKHATKTIIKNMNEQDRFGLVSYSDDSRIEFQLVHMTEENKNLALIATDNLQDEGCTNIWAGVNQGLEMLRNQSDLKNHQAIMLLTDGEPNIFPPSGLVNQFQKYRDSHPDFDFSLNSYAFGKHIDTPLLDKYAIIGNGQYSFIPCPGFIGTVFVNGIANILSTMGSNCQLDIEMKNGVKISHVLGNLPVKQKGKKCTIQVGDLKFDQSRDIVFEIEVPDEKRTEKMFEYMDVKLQYFDYSKKKLTYGKIENQIYNDWEDPLVIPHQYRNHFVDQVQEAVKVMKQKKDQQAQEIIEQLGIAITKDLKHLEDLQYDLDEDKDAFKLGRVDQALELLKGLKQDVDGEVKLAVAKDYSFDHWGKHFLPSLCHAHSKQQCNNFCDPGIQKYGGAFFQKIKEEVEQTFLKLPAPKPSKKQNDYDMKRKLQKQQQQNQNQNVKNNQQKNVQNNKQNVQNNNNNNIVKNYIQPQQEEEDDNKIDMNDYYNCGGGCFQGNGLVKLADGNIKKVKQLQKGDKILGLNGKTGQIKCVIQINSGVNNKYGYFPMVQLKESGLKITPKHPVYNEKQQKWVKPYKLPHLIVKNEKIVYNFVLEENMDNNNSLIIDGICCVSLGHQIKDIDAQHDYFGTSRIIRDIEKIAGFNKGKIIINDDQFDRDERKSVNGIQNILKLAVQ